MLCLCEWREFSVALAGVPLAEWNTPLILDTLVFVTISSLIIGQDCEDSPRVPALNERALGGSEDRD